MDALLPRQARLHHGEARRTRRSTELDRQPPRYSRGIYCASDSKGPAETAGIVEGERIVSINGVDLRINSADAGDSYASGLASRRLTRELAKVTPGNRVSLRVWSGGRVRDVQVTAGRASELREGGAFGMLEGMVPGAFTFSERPGGRMLRSVPRVRAWTAPRMRLEDSEISTDSEVSRD